MELESLPDDLVSYSGLVACAWTWSVTGMEHFRYKHAVFDKKRGVCHPLFCIGFFYLFALQ